MEKNLEKMARLIQNIVEEVLKWYNVAQGTHENKDGVHVGLHSINNHILGIFDYNSGYNHG